MQSPNPRLLQVLAACLVFRPALAAVECGKGCPQYDALLAGAKAHKTVTLFESADCGLGAPSNELRADYHAFDGSGGGSTLLDAKRSWRLPEIYYDVVNLNAKLWSDPMQSLWNRNINARGWTPKSVFAPAEEMELWFVTPSLLKDGSVQCPYPRSQMGYNVTYYPPLVLTDDWNKTHINVTNRVFNYGAPGLLRASNKMTGCWNDIDGWLSKKDETFEPETDRQSSMIPLADRIKNGKTHQPGAHWSMYALLPGTSSDVSNEGKVYQSGGDKDVLRWKSCDVVGSGTAFDTFNDDFKKLSEQFRYVNCSKLPKHSSRRGSPLTPPLPEKRGSNV